jgi:hypothetical protein
MFEMTNGLDVIPSGSEESFLAPLSEPAPTTKMSHDQKLTALAARNNVAPGAETWSTGVVE